MSNVTQNLLSCYYGFDKNSDEQISKFLSSHESIDDSVKTFTEASIAESIATGRKFDGDTENESTTNSKNDSKSNRGKSLDDVSVRTSRVLDEKAFLNDNDNGNDYEKFLVASSLGTDYNFGKTEVSPIDKLSPDCKIMADDKTIQESEDTHMDTNLTLIQDVIPDSASDISSTPVKTKLHGKLKTPVVPLPPIPKKGPSCNGIYLDWPNVGIEEFPSHIIKSYPGLRMLYLENNKLAKLPDELFTTLKNLMWLDVRNNLLTYLPESIKYHASLETILLQGNKIERLPLELCLLPNLRELKVARNPLYYPPMDVVNLGCQAIRDFLRSEWNILHPNEAIEEPKNQEIKAKPSTILCYQSKQNTKKMTKNIPTMSKYATFKSPHPKKKSVREKSWRYTPSNRCESQGTNSMLEQRLACISKVREMLQIQALSLQRTKDIESLKDWRRDRRSYEKSINKAASRTEADIPFAVNWNDLPPTFKSISKNKDNKKEKRRQAPPRFQDYKMKSVG
ncbi:uncharacterized protein LOC107267295 isoform X2 [Cephus cinctus]|uniref:Uncharacterized protein LOC107267295 isoform X2 n=1 Tax=Cephus cinctus TaxID=211228 RepID=A0AAJ7W0R4_CEPCN|nr:uncharacterized protein LOC107267295 isoform X2 [Cephus cinctus]